ncbi:amidophosphoribosyltransferase [Spizellomyces punctatus DAOM BR117]|uniref:Amidophosphoribosyltransferase n=1 Tax=Spizellomyces punctatus (strain DAOM BR117) TaxID=645134 RepID=A0A0L0HAP3_SPIPD|nr:amidophosphoribosyltransferase [Spizellomyces punctatus DAOM BR117]KNC98620.1 amidophosphoribosyltransferase [Spizellomyces punctatus DAOM BR117]|eukprot:XP_016606660.1 amidophosphoribosyltransferase [Spizellomyces punctatus DAOM BR117]
MCGITAVILADSTASASAELYEALGLLQHRGQDAAGIITCGHKGRLYQCKGNGMVRDVFEPRQLVGLQGSLGVGHVRYPTAGTSSNAEAQPFYVNSPYGIVFAHNGNLTNSKQLRNFLDHEAHRHVNTDSDSELLLNIFADHLNKTGKFRVNEDDIFSALGGVYKQCRGGYACVGMIAGFGLLGFRDPNGIRPLIYGERQSSEGKDYMMASESVVLEALGFTSYVDVQPGEAVIITKNGITKRQCVTGNPFTPDIFEYVYFARPDSIMDGVSVYKARLAMGEALAEAVLRKLGKHMDVDVVIPVPDTSRSAALQVSYKLNILYREGFIKNRYIGRTFIMPGQQLRKKSVRRKLNPMHMEFHDKNVLLVDDSIVRGTTSQEIIQMARDAGAKKVYFASCAPPIRYPNVYGIDMPTRQELVAWNRTDDEVAEAIGADCVIYQELRDLVQSVAKFNPQISQFDVSVFNGCYVTGDIDEEYFLHLERLRNDNTRDSREPAAADVIGLHNSFQS